jgi:hypothetical protein
MRTKERRETNKEAEKQERERGRKEMKASKEKKKREVGKSGSHEGSPVNTEPKF